MLKSKRMPKEFWAEVVQCAIYVHNRCPHTKLDDQTPQEAWSGQKPTISHLKVFGSVAYAHIPDQKRTKLEDKSKRYIFIGYDEKTKWYKLLDPINKMVIVSHDVRVNEASEWDWNNLTEVNIEVGESSVACWISIISPGKSFSFRWEEIVDGKLLEENKMRKTTKRENDWNFDCASNQVVWYSKQISYLNVNYPKNGWRVAN